MESKGLHTEKITESNIPFKDLVSAILKQSNLNLIDVGQFCDDGEGVLVRYNVFKIHIGKTDDEAFYVLKKSDSDEIFVYEKLLANKTLPVPKYYGQTGWNDEKWILIDYIPGTDLRDFTADMAYACAESITAIQNTYWLDTEDGFKVNQTNLTDQQLNQRFDRYWKRINKRAECLRDEPVLKKAYQIFLKRQLSCPRALCNGDFLQYNGIYQDGKVVLIDWAFAGIMPYSLDIARLIAHGTENKVTFPFYMNDTYRGIYIREVYDRLLYKPEKSRYLLDIKLSLLNEYIEFIEDELLDISEERDIGFDYYYNAAIKLAEEIIRS